MSRVSDLVTNLHEILQELVDIEKESNTEWRAMTETLNVLDHELEIIPLRGGELLKVASFRRKLRLERRKNKNAWYESQAFNSAFQTTRILNSSENARKHLSRQEKAGENLIENRGLIASILATKPDVIETDEVLALPSAELVYEIQSSLLEVAATEPTENVEFETPIHQ